LKRRSTVAVIDKRPPWFGRITRLIEKCWASHGPCGSRYVTSVFDTESGEWLIVAAPVFQEVLGGEDDGKKVWTGFVFHAEKLLRAMTVVHLSAGSYCLQCNSVPTVTFMGRYRGHRITLKVLLEPAPGSQVVEVIDTIKCEIRAKREQP
jgi:hypothetical protein